ncbi:MAG TPA: signal peptide peptidase SppA [Abditibacteriaceae bacterium]|nr:signal peptide peptidase SppA [Abditibacteriaceae bacterium]
MAFIAVVVSGGAPLGPRVGLIELSGPISDEGARGILGGGSQGGARQFIEDVEVARKDPTITAVVVRINSPGGSAAASQEMYAALRRLRLDKPVVCSMGDFAASGGYYVAAACDKIYANPSTLTGSIGVISGFMNFRELFDKLGIESDTIKSGKFKDAGNPARPLTPEERQLFKSMIMNVYSQFVGDVVAGRKGPTRGKLTTVAVRKLADGRVYTGQQAKANGLVDEIGGLHDAVQAAAKMGDIAGVPKVKEIGSSGLLSGLLGASDNSAAARSVAEISGAVGAAAGKAFAASVLQSLQAESQQQSRPQAR